MFITLEGGEGAGKTSVAKMLAAYFENKGIEVLLTREPGGCLLSEEIRTLVLEKKTTIYPRAELLLFLAARVQHLEEEILPALKRGVVVICDRFHDSTIAYQGYGRDLGASFVEDLCYKACTSFDGNSHFKPDLTFFLDVPVEVGLKRAFERRGGDDRIGQEKKVFHEKVREGFLALAKNEPDRIVTIDATYPLEIVLKNVEQELIRKGIDETYRK